MSTSRYPLGWPAGSIRALLTLLVVGIVSVEIYRDHSLNVLWAETLMIVLAHYFTTRRFLQLTPELMEQLQRQGEIDREITPLNLPRHTIRIIVITAFAILTALLILEDRLWDTKALSIIVVVFAYLAGVGAKLLAAWYWEAASSPDWWEDAKALCVILLMATLAAFYLLDIIALLPNTINHAAPILVLFYFGSR